MSINKPFFFLHTSGEQVRACHNCNGGVSFCATSEVLSPDMVRLIEFALEEGARRRGVEIMKLLSG